MMLNVFIGICLISALQVSVNSAPQAATEQPTQKKGLQDALGSFTLQLSEHISASQPHRNYVVSPLSIYAALALIYLGSSGDTNQELHKALNLEFAKDKDNQAVHHLIGDLLNDAQESNYSKLYIADAVFASKNIKVNDQYEQNLKRYYNSIVESVDFATDDNKATDTVNEWVSQHTDGRIPKLYDGKIDPKTVVLLVSALYFEAEWQNQFPVDMTKKAIFHGVESNVEVDMMQNMKFIPYYESEKYSAIGIPFKDGENFFYIVLPNENETLHTAVSSFTLNDYHSVIQQSQVFHVDYRVPKFKLKFRKSLNDILRKLGIEKSFDQTKANFDNLASSRTYVNEVVHSAELEVNEVGTTGSAATGITMFLTSMPKRFTVDKPFVFAIYHVKSATIVFNGAVYNPLE